MEANPAHDPTQATVVFHARALSKIYVMGEVKVHALREIDLDIYEGEFVMLLGPSGSGKSTLLNILGGLDRATSGAAAWRDHDLTRITVFTRDNATIVPAGALFRVGQSWKVYVVKDGRAELRDVTLLRRDGGAAAVTARVEPGERVIVYPSDRVAAGVRVEARK